MLLAIDSFNFSVYRNAEKFLAEDVRSFLKDTERQTGAQLFVFAGFQKADGNVVVTK
jgi:hypothetical protein